MALRNANPTPSKGGDPKDCGVTVKGAGKPQGGKNTPKENHAVRVSNSGHGRWGV